MRWILQRIQAPSFLLMLVSVLARTVLKGPRPFFLMELEFVLEFELARCTEEEVFGIGSGFDALLMNWLSCLN